jgi:hypothetical protein
LILKQPKVYKGYAVAQLVEALRYNSEGHGFDSRWGINVTTVTMGSIQSVTEMSTRNISLEVKRPVCRAEKFVTINKPID